MSRMSVAERLRLSVFLGRGLMHRVANRVTGLSLINLPFVPSKVDRLVIAPQDLRTSDATRASEIYSGRFSFAGKVVVCDASSPFQVTPPSDEWAAGVHGFGWLRHLRAAETEVTRANARALVNEWITHRNASKAIASRPDVVARRIMSWLTQATLVLEDSEVRFYRRFMRSLTYQVRTLRHTYPLARDGVPRLQAAIALTYAALCMQGQARYVASDTERLGEELARQILPDGGHISRNPGALVELLVDLLPLRQVFSARNIPPPAALLNAIDRMMPMLRFFRHGDGHFGLFNGMGPTPTDLVTTILAYDDARGTPVANAPHSGYQRIEAGGTLILMDTGRVPPLAVSQEANAGCLAFELSSKAQRIVVNCGLPGTNRDSWRQMARTTAAHSTVTFCDQPAGHFVDSGTTKRLLDGIPIVGGPRLVEVAREDHNGGTLLRAAHDGYSDEFGVIHQRALMLSADGKRIDGEEFFTATRSNASLVGRDNFAVRFHLHPMIKANRLTDSHGAMLLLPNKDVWSFNAYEDRVEIEESVYLAGNQGPRRTTQIVIYGHARKIARVQWTFSFAAASPIGIVRRPRNEEKTDPM
ncbi:MAG TPA: heparinase II/III family protein [Xanthobacteraceae bacterium]|nr:heparinase II/III family protein [Xanthobacteraceae bacterium]